MKSTTDSPSAKSLVLATMGALLVAVLIVFGAVLPAEYGVDPLGTGRALGLLALSQVQPITRADGEYRTDVVDLELAPTEWVESSYRFEEGAGMVYSWQATGDVSYNFHSAPDGAPVGYAETYDAQVSDRADGAYTAPFTGTHGWYWENVGTDYVTIRLTTAGFYTSAHEGRSRASGERQLRDARGQPLR
jgi:hypothetical protein